MIYVSTLSFLFILLSFSNFITFKFQIKNNQSYFISCCIIILIAYFSFFIDRKYNLNTLYYLFFFLLFFSIYLFLSFDLNFFKKKKNSNLDFIIFFFIIFFFSQDRYYLDQDEFTYWGPAIKELLLGLQPYNHFTHHPKGTSLFQYLLLFFNYNEGLAIFANNTLLIAGFFFLFYERNLSIIEKIILSLIYYLLLNNLSFGFLSIYSDPVVAIFFSCILKLIYFFKIKIKTKENLQFYFSFSFIFLTSLLINRASIIYALFLLILLYFSFFNIFKNKYKNMLNFFFIFILIIFFSFIVKIYILPRNYDLDLIIINIIKFFKYHFLSDNFIKLFTSPIYFSNFGSLFNGILAVFSFNNFFPQFPIPLFLYILILCLIFLYSFNYKFFFAFFCFFFIFVYSVIVFILKFQIEELHILALQRYIGIFLLANYLFYISIINKNYRPIYKNYILIFFIIFLISVTPKKTIGFFVNDKIYYSNASNNNFHINREKIAKLKNFQNVDRFFVVHKDRMSDYTNEYIAGTHTFYYNIISYELYPKKILFVEYEKFIKDIDSYKRCGFDNCFFIIFDLTENQLNKISYFKNSFIINTY
jgi:hypothetical protein